MLVDFHFLKQTTNRTFLLLCYFNTSLEPANDLAEAAYRDTLQDTLLVIPKWEA